MIIGYAKSAAPAQESADNERLRRHQGDANADDYCEGAAEQRRAGRRVMVLMHCLGEVTPKPNRRKWKTPSIFSCGVTFQNSDYLPSRPLPVRAMFGVGRCS